MARVSTAMSRALLTGTTIGLEVLYWKNGLVAPMLNVNSWISRLSRLTNANERVYWRRFAKFAHIGLGICLPPMCSNHVHVVVEATDAPEKIMNDLKSYASRRLNETRIQQKRWSRHGSTRRLWKDDDVRSAVRYVIDEQGEAMAAFEAEGVW
jgi:REP element-mobilizing transposase RayT